MPRHRHTAEVEQLALSYETTVLVVDSLSDNQELLELGEAPLIPVFELHFSLLEICLVAMRLVIAHRLLEAHDYFAQVGKALRQAALAVRTRRRGTRRRR